MVVSACQADIVTGPELTPLFTQPTMQPTSSEVILAAETPEQPASEEPGEITLDYSAVAQFEYFKVG